MLPSDRNRRNYLGFNFSNLRALLRGVSINNLAFTRNPFGTRDAVGRPCGDSVQRPWGESVQESSQWD